nr:hypothetical protein [Tanacetum cinerariifolium]
MSTLVFADPESSTQADGAQSSRVPVPLPEDPYEVIRQTYLVGMDTESEPFEDPESETPVSPHIIAPPTCHVEESKGSGTSGARSMSLDSTAPLLPDHPLTHTTPVLVPILCRTAPFHKRFRSSYNSSPSPTLPIRKRYKGTSELILGIDSKEIDECSDSDSESEDAEDKGSTVEDEDPAAGVEGPGVDDETYGLDDESYGLYDKSHGEEEDVPEGQQQAASVVRTTVSMPLRLGFGELRRLELALEEDLVYSMFKTHDSLPISPSLSVVPSPVSSPMILLNVPSPISLPMATSTATILVDKDQFIEGAVRDEIFSQRYRFRSLEHEQERTVVTFGALWRPVLALKAWTALQRELQEMRDRVTALEQERDRKER